MEKQSSSEEYRAAFQILLDYQHKGPTGVSYYLSDIRDQGVVRPEDRNWFETYALPTAKSRGLKKASIVISGNIFKQYYVNLILATAKSFGFPLKAFNNWSACVQWLFNDESAYIDLKECR